MYLVEVAFRKYRDQQLQVGEKYKIKPDELYILSFEKGRAKNVELRGF